MTLDQVHEFHHPYEGHQGRSDVRPAAPTATEDLLRAARRSLTEAVVARTPAERFAAAHLAALRGAAAVLAARSRATSRAQLRSVWSVLPEVAGEFAEWAAFFAAGSGKRASAQLGHAVVSAREADDLVRDAEAFLARVAGSLGLSHQSVLIGA